MSNLALSNQRVRWVSWRLAPLSIAAAAVMLFPPFSGYQDYLLYNAGLAAHSADGLPHRASQE